MNLMSTRYAIRNRIATRAKNNKEQYALLVADSTELPFVDRETIPLLLAFQQHYEEAIFDVLSIASYDIVIGFF